jgi:hypothetical protein
VSQHNRYTPYANNFISLAEMLVNFGNSGVNMASQWPMRESFANWRSLLYYDKTRPEVVSRRQTADLFRELAFYGRRKRIRIDVEGNTLGSNLDVLATRGYDNNGRAQVSIFIVNRNLADLSLQLDGLRGKLERQVQYLPYGDWSSVQRKTLGAAYDGTQAKLYLRKRSFTVLYLKD